MKASHCVYSHNRLRFSAKPFCLLKDRSWPSEPRKNTDIDILLVVVVVVGSYLHPHASPWILTLALRAQQSHENPVLEMEPIM